MIDDLDCYEKIDVENRHHCERQPGVTQLACSECGCLGLSRVRCLAGNSWPALRSAEAEVCRSARRGFPGLGRPTGRSGQRPPSLHATTGAAAWQSAQPSADLECISDTGRRSIRELANLRPGEA